jgi:hypothetical protein
LTEELGDDRPHRAAPDRTPPRRGLPWNGIVPIGGNGLGYNPAQQYIFHNASTDRRDR